MKLPIKGLARTSLVDFPPYTASTVFIGGCNFRCRFCHNPDLVLRQEKVPDISQEEIFEYLESKKDWIDGVCITGGEPLLYESILGFITKIKEKGFLVKIDTNGTNPELLKRLINDNLVDRIAMDIKSDPENYEKAAGAAVDIEKIKRSIRLIRESGKEYEFRTTVVPGLVGKEEIRKIGKWLKGSKIYAIQNFKVSKDVIDEKMKDISPYLPSDLEEMKDIASEYFEEVEIRD